MTNFEYYFHHCIPTGWQTVKGAFTAWRDLLSGNWEPYALLGDDDPFTECREWFWQLLGEDNVYPKKFLEDLQEIVRRINTGEEELIEMNTEKFLEALKDLED
jgi:hypothetical protein